MIDDGLPLNRVQLRMVDMLSRGVSQREIAELLGFNYNSMRRRLMYVRAEVGALSNEHLIAICFKRGWLPIK